MPRPAVSPSVRRLLIQLGISAALVAPLAIASTWPDPEEASAPAVEPTLAPEDDASIQSRGRFSTFSFDAGPAGTDAARARTDAVDAAPAPVPDAAAAPAAAPDSAHAATPAENAAILPPRLD